MHLACSDKFFRLYIKARQNRRNLSIVQILINPLKKTKLFHKQIRISATRIKHRKEPLIYRILLDLKNNLKILCKSILSFRAFKLAPKVVNINYMYRSINSQNRSIPYFNSTSKWRYASTSSSFTTTNL